MHNFVFIYNLVISSKIFFYIEVFWEKKLHDLLPYFSQFFFLSTIWHYDAIKKSPEASRQKKISMPPALDRIFIQFQQIFPFILTKQLTFSSSPTILVQNSNSTASQQSFFNTTKPTSPIAAEFAQKHLVAVAAGLK